MRCRMQLTLFYKAARASGWGWGWLVGLGLARARARARASVLLPLLLLLATQHLVASLSEQYTVYSLYV